MLTKANRYCQTNFNLIDCIIEDNKITIYGNEIKDESMTTGSDFLVVIPTTMSVGLKIKYNEYYSEE